MRLDNLLQLVFDEADRMLSIGFLPGHAASSEIPSFRAGNTGSMFSATIPPHVLRLAQQFLTQPEFLSLSRDRVHVFRSRTCPLCRPGYEKGSSADTADRSGNPAAALVFCNTRRTVDLCDNRPAAIRLRRRQTQFRSQPAGARKGMARGARGKLRLLVADRRGGLGASTFPNCPHVFQYEPPDDTESTFTAPDARPRARFRRCDFPDSLVR